MSRFFGHIVSAFLFFAAAGATLEFAHAQLNMPAFGGGTSAASMGWHVLPIGAGGYLTSFDIECDQGVGACNGRGTATLVTRTDTYGAWYYNPSTTNCGNANRTGCWQQIITATAMPSGTVGSGGVYEIVIAPSNTSHWYMLNNDGYVYHTTNKGTSWTKASTWSKVPTDANDTTRLFGQRIAVDPQNENVAYFGTPGAGVFYTTNGGKSFTKISTITIPAGGAIGTYGGGNLIAFDPSDATGNTVYITSYGNGVYKCTSASTSPSCSETSTIGMPTTYRHMIVDFSGIVWMLDNSGTQNNVYTYNGSWSHNSVTTSGGASIWQAVAVDPNHCTSASTCHVIIQGDNGYLNITQNGGRTWSDEYRNWVQQSPDIPWLAANNESYLSSGNIQVDPTQSTLTVDMSAGLGFYQTQPPALSSSRLTWTTISAAIEQLDGLWGVSPPGGNPIVTFQDRPAFTVTSFTQYPSNYECMSILGPGNSIQQGWGVDYASQSPSTIVLQAGRCSAYSSNGGASWTPFATLPTDMFPTGSTGGPAAMLGGGIAASTSTNFVMALSDNGNLEYTTDGGSTWSVAMPTGVPLSTTGVTNSRTSSGGTTLNFNPTSFATAYSILTAMLGAGIQMNAQDVTNFGATGNSIPVASVTPSSVTLRSGLLSNTGSGEAFMFRPDPGTGWGYQAFGKQQTICADKVNPGIFYAYNYGPIASAGGIWKSNNGGATWSRASSTTYSGSGNNAIFQCVPGEAGDMYLTYAINTITGTPFYECTDSSGRVTCHVINNISNVSAYGFGPTKTGSGYPCIYFYGATSRIQGLSRTQGYYQSCDHFATAPKLIGASHQGTLDWPIVLIGDSNTYGLFYVCFDGSGCQYDQTNFLLKRDLDPASNDNAPAYLNAAA